LTSKENNVICHHILLGRVKWWRHWESECRGIRSIHQVPGEITGWQCNR